jgi:hypothetical protein
MLRGGGGKGGGKDYILSISGHFDTFFVVSARFSTAKNLVMSNFFEDAKRAMRTRMAKKLTDLPTKVKMEIISVRRVQCGYGPTWMLRVREPGRFQGDDDVWANE